MADNAIEAAEAVAKLLARAEEHESSSDENYREYAAGIRDAIKALEPFLAGAKPPVSS